MNNRDCRIIELPKIHDPRGNLSVIEGTRQIPFEIKRIFYLYDVPGGETRGGHANINLQQVIIAITGSFDVVVDDGYKRQTFTLDCRNKGLYIPGMIWRELSNFSSGAVCMVLTDNYYNHLDYFRDYDAFIKTKRGVN